MKILESYTLCNRSKRPLNIEIDTIVIHHTGDFSCKGTLAWFKDPASKASAQYVIDLDGQIYKVVPEFMKAWHAGYSWFKGKYWVNNFSIGIELVGDGNKKQYTEAQMESLVWLCADIIKRNPKITIDRITSHSHIRAEYQKRGKVKVATKVDPGKYFDWVEFQKKLDKKLNPPTPKKQKSENGLFSILSFIIKLFSR